MSVPMTTWNKCSDQMPPDDESKFIVKSDGGYPSGLSILTGGEVSLYFKYNRVAANANKWTPYTKDLWEELNK